MRPKARPRLDDAERRRRIGVRQGLAPRHWADGPVDATRSVVALHATDPPTIVLSTRARSRAMEADDVDAALREDRSLVATMAMRRTIWVVPADLVAAVVAGPGRRVATRERARLVKDVEAHGLHEDGEAWFDRARDQVMEVLGSGADLSMAEIRDQAPALSGSFRQGLGKSWEADVPIGPRVLTALWAAGEIVRSTNDGGWWVSRPRWTTTASWLGTAETGPWQEDGAADGTDPQSAWNELVRRWLSRFGPGTETDVVWWLGATKAIVRTAFESLGTVEVDVERDGVAHVLPGDDGPTAEVEPWAALLPVLDPTTMGWKQRDWYLGPHAPDLVDTAGNAGPTVWWDGRIVGGWHQGEDGSVGVVLLDDVGRDATAAIEAEADALEAFMAGRRVLPRFPSPLFRRATGR